MSAKRPIATVNWKYSLKIIFSAAFAGWLTVAHAETWRFALIGDVPYSDYERAQLPKMLENIADSQAELVAHIGDFKHGKERCDDAIFEDRLQLFNASRIPFIFVPGDNEWTDCSRKSNGAYEPLERLSRLRSLFWPNDQSLGRKSSHLSANPSTHPNTPDFDWDRYFLSASTSLAAITTGAKRITLALNIWLATRWF